MGSRTILAGLAAMALAVAGLAAGPPGASAAPAYDAQQPPGTSIRHVCPTKVKDGFVTCFAEQLITSDAPSKDGPPAGALTPKQLQDAYSLTGLKSGGRTVAIVDAYGYPNLERDLGIFRAHFGLSRCTVNNGCLTIMNQRGHTAPADLPPFQGGWAGEQALDVDAVSSACPDCRILVVQADTSSFGNMTKAVARAAVQTGVVAISNSYGGRDAKDSTWGRYYHHRGIAVTASTGDSGFNGPYYPSSSRFVTAVGGTSLVKDKLTSRGWTEWAWRGAGSGCSTYNRKLKAAQGVNTSCRSMRAASDVSAAADPNRGGLAWYYPVNENDSQWGQVGGTSESTPIIASVYALSGNTGGEANAIPYRNRRHLYDVTSGSNGTCDGGQICTAGHGWDGPTGLGTPNGTGAF
ncbi:MAG: S53 family peptidase [Nocardioidaceae bacterium]